MAGELLPAGTGAWTLSKLRPTGNNEILRSYDIGGLMPWRSFIALFFIAVVGLILISPFLALFYLSHRSRLDKEAGASVNRESPGPDISSNLAPTTYHDSSTVEKLMANFPGPIILNWNKDTSSNFLVIFFLFFILAIVLKSLFLMVTFGTLLSFTISQRFNGLYYLKLDVDGFEQRLFFYRQRFKWAEVTNFRLMRLPTSTMISISDNCSIIFTATKKPPSAIDKFAGWTNGIGATFDISKQDLLRLIQSWQGRALSGNA